MNNEILRIDNLTVSFDGFLAVDKLDLFIEENELRCIIGPNGAGKTTLLDMICGKTRPTSGTIRFQGSDITATVDYGITRKGIGRKFQTPSVYEDLTVEDNLEISHPRHHGVLHSLFFRRDATLDQKIASVAADVYLTEHLGTKAGILSHGQKQWLEIGMLLMQEPQLLLIDEPVAGMTPQETERTAELLLSLAGTHSLVVVEHDMDFVRSIARRVTVLHEGRVLADGSIDAVQSDPKVIEVYLGH